MLTGSIHCDIYGCDSVVTISSLQTFGYALFQAGEAAAAALGWTKIGNHHYCGKHFTMKLLGIFTKWWVF